MHEEQVLEDLGETTPYLPGASDEDVIDVSFGRRVLVVRRRRTLRFMGFTMPLGKWRRYKVIR